jgi:hypothetical protein
MSLDKKHVALCLLTYVRWEYFEEVFESIVTQLGADSQLGIPIDFYIFQDGLLGSESEEERKGHLHIKQYVATRQIDINFKSFDRNLGPAKAFDHIENFLYEAKGYEFVIFCEDDLVLSRNYVKTLLTLAQLVSSDNRVAMISCFSDHRTSREDQFAHSSRVIGMTHHWAFGMFRDAWRARQHLVRPYLRLIERFPYRQRPHQEVMHLQRLFGFKAGPTSQDYFKACACATLGLVRISTQILLGRYIGRNGLHFNPQAFSQYGFDSTVIYEGEVPASFEWSESRYREILKGQQATVLLDSEDHQSEIPYPSAQTVTDLRKSEQWQTNTATAADAIAVYKVFLNRLPENDSVINSLVGKPPSSLLISAILSDEFIRSRTGRAAIITAARRVAALPPHPSLTGNS